MVVAASSHRRQIENKILDATEEIADHDMEETHVSIVPSF